ncbi:UDP-glucose 4-epimerase GalE [Variovorax ginsengisoli]|uniref:UDP-glucose 4-epimerase n=1 Tax=Variovorax ginsengisoli TaxID=363844 RepID=A0ABT9SEH0_9BURK|nr:UDP-glucose 4-epimerase GalE [Variovorax ginsengisoli]MDP9902178.1 UDP-glucose 4-epimerase [Variovorax ginsengisoli]
MPTSHILVTGGAGFIGSHTCVALTAAGYTPIVLDSFSNSDVRVLDRIERISGQRPLLVQGDVRDGALLSRVFEQHAVAGVIHFAGLKAVGDSVADPLQYYDVNVGGTVILARAMAAAQVKTLIFSSSATVYGEPERSPIPEEAPYAAASPYGRTKRMVEEILADLHFADPAWRIARLRYFNPVGAHESGLIGEHPNGKPNNLMPFVSQVAVGLRERLTIHGGDYPTPDGTGVRDYVHVMDLAEGHVAALRHVMAHPGLLTLNLGTGIGGSVLDVVRAFERVSGKTIARDVGPRRSGDVPAYWADVTQAKATLGWEAKRDIEQMCADSWRWQQGNPKGYEG